MKHQQPIQRWILTINWIHYWYQWILTLHNLDLSIQIMPTTSYDPIDHNFWCLTHHFWWWNPHWCVIHHVWWQTSQLTNSFFSRGVGSTTNQVHYKYHKPYVLGMSSSQVTKISTVLTLHSLALRCESWRPRNSLLHPSVRWTCTWAGNLSSFPWEIHGSPMYQPWFCDSNHQRARNVVTSLFQMMFVGNLIW